MDDDDSQYGRSTKLLRRIASLFADLQGVSRDHAHLEAKFARHGAYMQRHRALAHTYYLLGQVLVGASRSAPMVLFGA